MNVKDELIKRLYAEPSVNGAGLASELNVSRNAIWKAAKTLIADGFDIESTKSGYKLVGKSGLSEAIISQHIGLDISSKNGIGTDVKVFSKVSSTNDVAKKLAKDGYLGVVAAETQGAGRGRFNRVFFSPPNVSAYFSVVIKPTLRTERLQMITAYTAVAVSKVITKLSGEPCQIKWVNDIYMRGKKICGVLTEAEFSVECNSLEYAVIGIGINVLSRVFPADLAATAGDIETLSGVKIDRNRLIGEITRELLLADENIKSGEFIRDYTAMSNIIGKEIIVNGEYPARAIGFSDDCSLIIETDGNRRILNSGEVSIKAYGNKTV